LLKILVGLPLGNEVLFLWSQHIHCRWDVIGF